MNETAQALLRLQGIVERLRAPDGCPWDREQTLADLGRYIVEEAAEARDAIEEDAASVPDRQARTRADVCEELGDVLMTVFLATRIAEEAGDFDLARVAQGISDKLVRRHPHVFGDARADDTDAVRRRWEEIKAEEKRSRPDAAPKSRLDGIPRSLPPLTRAQKISKRAAKHGLEWPTPAGVMAKVREECAELGELLENGSPADPERVEEELGDLLFSVVNLSRKLNLDADRALRSALRKFEGRFRELEQRLDLRDADPATIDRHWNQLKKDDS